MIRILYLLTNIVNQFCVIFGIVFNVGSLNCCKTNYSPFSQYSIFFNHIWLQFRIFLKELKLEIRCAVHYVRTSHIAFVITLRSVLYKIMISHDTQHEIPYVFKYVNYLKNLLILHKEL
jgi:hypothetical protein